MPRLRFHPRLEYLEDRALPAVNFQVVDVNGDTAKDLQITGGTENTRIYIREDGAAQEVYLSLDRNGNNNFTDPGDFEDRALVAIHGFDWTSGGIYLNLGGGHDLVDYQHGGGDVVGVTRLVQAGLGSGNNVFRVRSDVRLVGGSLSLDIRSGGGADTVDIGFLREDEDHANIDNAQLNVKASLGAGWDIFLMELANRPNNFAHGALDNGAAVDVEVRGGAGRNYCYIDVYNIGDTAASTFTVNYLGGADRNGDRLLWRLLGDVGNGSQVDLHASLLGGNDLFEGQLNPGSFDIDDTDAEVHWWVDGGDGNDKLSVTALPGDFEMVLAGWLDVTLLGGKGNDRLGFHFPPAAAFQLSGRLTLVLKGGAGNDRLGGPTLVLSNTADSTGIYEVTIQGNGGKDRVDIVLHQAGADVSFGPQGKIVVDGGGGIDRFVPGQPIPDNMLVQLFEQFEP